MKPAGPSLLAVVLAGTLVAQAEEAAERDKTSVRLIQIISSTLPPYEPPPDPSVAAPTATTPDPDVLELPKMIVQEKPRPRINPLDLLTKPAREEKMARDFKDSFKGLDSLLNGFSIPILSPSMAERGRAAYQDKQMRDLERIDRIGRETDAQAAKAASDATRAMKEQNRKAGE